MRKVVLISQQGSGTNLLRSFLNSHPHVEVFDELFTKSERWEEKKNDANDGREAVRGYLDEFFYDHETFRQNYVKRKVKDMPNKHDVRVRGFDLKYNNVVANPDIFDEIGERYNKGDIAVVHLIRDPGRTFLRRFNDENQANIKYEDFVGYLNTVGNWVEKVRNRFSGPNDAYGNYLELYYEDMTRGQEVDSLPLDFEERVLTFLDVGYWRLYKSKNIVRGEKLHKRF